MTLTLKDFFQICWKKLWIIILCVLVLALCGGLYAKLIVKKTYTSDLAFLARIENQTTQTQVSTDVGTVSKLLPAYVEIISKKQYFESVADELETRGVRVKRDKLAESVRYSAKAAELTIDVSVTTHDAAYSLAVAKAIKDTAPDYLSVYYPVEGILFQVINEPVLATAANGSGALAYVLVCALLGLLLGVLLVVLIYYFDVRVKSEKDLTARYPMPVLGVLPKFWEEKGKNREIVRKDYLLDQHSEFQLVESYRNLMTNVGFAIPKKEGALCFCVTSSCAGEGKSTVAANLASTFSNSGKRVLLIDGDLRKGRLNQFFRAVAPVGISNYLCGLAELDEIVQPTPIERLDAIYAGGSAPNPIELFQSERFDELLDAMSARYDYIVLDTPPVEVVADALSIIPKTDGVVFVVAEQYSRHTNLTKSLKRLEFSNCKLFGCVLADSRTLTDTYKTRSYHQYYDAYKPAEGEKS